MGGNKVSIFNRININDPCSWFFDHWKHHSGVSLTRTCDSTISALPSWKNFSSFYLPLRYWLIFDRQGDRCPKAYVCYKKITNTIFWSFLTQPKQDEALPSHGYRKIRPSSAQFWLGFLGSSSILLANFFLTPCVVKHLKYHLGYRCTGLT